MMTPRRSPTSQSSEQPFLDNLYFTLRSLEHILEKREEELKYAQQAEARATETRKSLEEECLFLRAQGASLRANIDAKHQEATVTARRVDLLSKEVARVEEELASLKSGGQRTPPPTGPSE